MTDAERQARRDARKEEGIARWRAALERIRTARTVREARHRRGSVGREAARGMTPRVGGQAAAGTEEGCTVPVELATLTDARGEPMGEWASEPMPGTFGRWVRLIVRRTNEWSPAVRAGREEEVARAVAALDLDVALFGESPPDRAKDALRELVEGHALLLLDPLTAEMLEAFGWGPLSEPKEEPRGNGGITL
jgi:hypothetical protein